MTQTTHSTHIGDLIQQHCPNGVEFLPLDEIFFLKNGYTPSRSNSSFWSDGSVPWFRMEDIRENGRILHSSIQEIAPSAVKAGKLFPANSLLVATSATIGEHALVTVPHLSNQRFTSLALKPKYKNRLDMKFAFYYGFVLAEWCKKNTTMSSFASVDMPRFRRFSFPLPPLVVQEEIVRILDTFKELEAELEAELKARCQQYEHYRNTSFASIRSADTINLGAICRVETGESVSKAKIDKNPGSYPVINSGKNPLGYIDSYNTEDDPIGITSRGAGVGSVTWCDGRYFRGALNYSVSIEDYAKVDIRYLFHALNFLQPQIKRLSTFQGIPALNKSNLAKLRVPLPPVIDQRRLATFLDGFDTLTSDLSVGLPAEIAARRQQYEHYRDQLLSFRELAE